MLTDMTFLVVGGIDTVVDVVEVVVVVASVVGVGSPHVSSRYVLIKKRFTKDSTFITIPYQFYH